MARGEPIGEMIFKRLIRGDPDEFVSKDSTVLSCGGMYIPHRGNRACTIHQIINTPGNDEVVKIITGARPQNILHQVLLKESLN